MSDDVPRVQPLAETVTAVAAAVRAVPGVADLHGGAYGEVATYLPGRRVRGIRLTSQAVDVHVTATWERGVRETAEAVADAAERAAGRPATVTVEDLQTPETATPQRNPDHTLGKELS